jgi:hypothetical protein
MVLARVNMKIDKVEIDIPLPWTIHLETLDFGRQYSLFGVNIAFVILNVYS